MGTEDDAESYYSALSRPLSQLDLGVGHPLASSEVYLTRGSGRSLWSGQTRTIKLREDETLLVKAPGWGALRRLSDERGSVVVVTEGFGDDWDTRRVEVHVVSSAHSSTGNSLEVSVRLSSSLPQSGLREDFWYAGLPHVPSISPIRIDELGLLGACSREEESQSGVDGAVLGLEGVLSFDSSENIDHESMGDGMSVRTGEGRKLVFEMEVPARLGDVLRRAEGEVFGNDGRGCNVSEKSGWSD